MSKLIRDLNKIKSNRTTEWLSPSQQSAFISIKTILRIPSTVNLFGHSGVGKTFLGWTLANELNFAYLSRPDLVNNVSGEKYDGVVLDNCYAERQAHRELLKILQFQYISRAVLITRQIIKDYTQFVELRLTDLDIIVVQKNLVDLGMSPVTRKDIPNLWYMVNSSL